jgi:hypothetical protein
MAAAQLGSDLQSARRAPNLVDVGGATTTTAF